MGARRGRWWSPLLGTFVFSLVLLVLVSGWLLTDPATSRADALRTGGFAAGAVVALYALWLNDRRRKVEESRQQVERQRHELELVRADRERDRVTDERFAKSVELLGHSADQVRVGALHALAGLARDVHTYKQTVLDVVCSYLRRPFEGEDERELQVRNTAQRLITELLPHASSVEVTYDLDLTGAKLLYFDLSQRKVGTLTMRSAFFGRSTNFSESFFTGPVWLTRAHAEGRFLCRDSHFAERGWFSGAEFDALADFSGSAFDGEFNAKGAVFAGPAELKNVHLRSTLELSGARFDDYADLRLGTMPKSVAFYNTIVNADREPQLPGEWELETIEDGRTRLSAVTRPS